MSKRKSIAILAIIAMVLTLMPAAMFGATADSDRLAGANRIETALEICDAGWETADTVILAAADEANLVDALAAGPLAAQEDAPILVTYKNALNADVKAKIADLGASKVIVVGAVSDDVVAEVETLDGVAVEKIAGKNRIETANLINAELDNVAGTFVVGYLGLPDALSVASYAAANNFAIAIAKADGTVDEESLLGETTYIVGGTARVADIDGAADRFAGSDRLATNAAVAEGLEFDFGKVYVANGRTLVDALAVAPLAAQTDSFVLLVETSKGTAVEGMTASSQIIAVGGTAAVPQKVLDNLFGGDDGEFTIKSVKAPNLIQLRLELNNTDYNKDELTDKSNYEFEGIEKDAKDETSFTIKGVTVKEKILTITLQKPVKNETTGTLTVNRVVTGEELVFEDIQFSDHSIPQIEDVQVIGKDTVKFVFSEPVNFYQPDGTTYNTACDEEFDFEQDGSAFSVKEVTPIKDGFEVNVTVYDNFDEGDLIAKIGNGLEDYAGFNIIPDEFELDVVEDTEAPYVTGYKDAKRDQVTLIFNEDIKRLSDNEKDYYHTNTSNTVVVVNDTVNSDVKINGNEMTLFFDSATNKLPEGTAYVYVKADAVSDLWDNKNSTIKTKVDIDVDTTKPEVSKVEWKDGKVLVTYSEGMGSNAEELDNYSLVEPDGDKATIRSADFALKADGSDNTKKVELTLRSTNPDKGTYELTIKKVEDNAGNAIAETTVEVEITDTKALSFAGLNAYYEDYGNKYRVYLEFGEELCTEGNYSVLDLYKYEISYTGAAGTYYNLGTLEENDEISANVSVVDSGKTVRITTDFRDADASASIANFYVRIAGRIADAQGNYTADTISPNIQFTAKSAANINILEVSAKSADTIEVKFDGYLTSFDEGDFRVWKDDGIGAGGTAKQYDSANDTLFSVQNVVKGSDPDKAIITLSNKKGNKLNADTTGYYLGTKATTKSKNASGRTLKAGYGDAAATGFAVADKIAPAVLKLDDQDKKDNLPSEAVGRTGQSDGVSAVWAETDGMDSVIYIQFNEQILDVTSTTGFSVMVDNKPVSVSALGISTTNGLFGPASGVKSLVKIEINNKVVVAGDSIEIGAGVITDNSAQSNRNAAATLFVEYAVKDVTGPLLTTIATPAIAGVTAPAKGASPVTTIAETTEYTATISWSGALDVDGKFAASTVYTATITITPKTGKTLKGVTANFFTVTGATATNDADSGVVTAVFPPTGA